MVRRQPSGKMLVAFEADFVLMDGNGLVLRHSERRGLYSISYCIDESDIEWTLSFLTKTYMNLKLPAECLVQQRLF